LAKRHLVFCRDINTPSGGRKMLYWLVDFLNSQGQNAYLIHQNPKFTSSWFEHKTRIACLFNYGLSHGFKDQMKQVLFNVRCFIKGVKPLTLNPESDILYFPETFLNQLDSTVYLSFNKWIVNQNAFFLLKQNFNVLQKLQLSNDNKTGILNFSKLNAEYSIHIFGNKLKQIQISAFVDDIFISESKIPKEKKKQIVVMPRRGNIQLQGIKKMLQLSGVIEANQWVEIENNSQEEVKQILSEALIFLTFSEFEGLGLPVAEAMCMECLVIGSPANGGEELFEFNLDFKINHGDWIQATQKINEIFKQFDSNPHFFDSHTAQNRAHILANYTKDSVEKNFKNHINQLNFL